MFKIERQSDLNLFTVNCYYYNQNSHSNEFLYSITNLTLTDLAQFMKGRGDSHCEEHIEVIFNSPQMFNHAYVNEAGSVLYVDPGIQVG